MLEDLSPLERLFACADWFSEGNLDGLMRYENTEYKTTGKLETAAESRFSVEVIFNHVVTLSHCANGLDLGWDVGEDERRAMERWLRTEPDLNPRLNEHREIAAFLLSIEPLEVGQLWAGPTTEQDKADVIAALDSIRQQLEPTVRSRNPSNPKLGRRAVG